MFAIHRHRRASLPERILIKLALKPAPVLQPIVLSPFSSAAWPKFQNGDEGPMEPLPQPMAIKPAPEFVEVAKPAPARLASSLPAEFQIPGKELLRANRVVELQRQHVDRVNQRQPTGCHVMALSLIPPEVWDGANATFMMMACDFFPASAANTMLLPVTRKGADHLQLPVYKFQSNEESVEMARLAVSKLREAFAAEHTQVAMAVQRGDLSSLANRPARKKKYADDLKGLANKLAVAQFGKKAVQDHQTTFGDALNYETPLPI